MSNYNQQDNKAPVAPIVMPKIESAIETSPTIGALGAALAKTQGEMGGALKDQQNPHLKNRYADLWSAWAAWKLWGPKNGLAIVQIPGTVSDGVTVTVTIVTMLTHSSGEWIRGTLAMPVKAERGRSDAQALGSAITYGRRYGMMAVTGLAAEDDDGNGAGSNNDRRYQNEPPPRQQSTQSANGNASRGQRTPEADRDEAFKLLEACRTMDDLDAAENTIGNGLVPKGHPYREVVGERVYATEDRLKAAKAS